MGKINTNDGTGDRCHVPLSPPRDQKIAAAPVHAATIEVFWVTFQVGDQGCQSSLVMPSLTTSDRREVEGVSSTKHLVSRLSCRAFSGTDGVTPKVSYGGYSVCPFNA